MNRDPYDCLSYAIGECCAVIICALAAVAIFVGWL